MMSDMLSWTSPGSKNEMNEETALSCENCVKFQGPETKGFLTCSQVPCVPKKKNHLNCQGPLGSIDRWLQDQDGVGGFVPLRKIISFHTNQLSQLQEIMQGTKVTLNIAHFHSKKRFFVLNKKEYILRFCFNFFQGLLGAISTEKKCRFRKL